MISDIGYAISAAAYLLLVLLLLTSRQSGLAKHLLVLAGLGTAVWSLSFVSQLAGELSPQRLYVADALKQFVWLLFLASCLQKSFASLWQVLQRPETIAILALPVFVLVLPYLIVLEPMWLTLLQTVLALEMLILLELVYRQAGDQQWTFKPLIMFLGATQLYEFVLYANATMVSEVDGRYIAARGYIYFLLAPLLVLAVRRIKHWGINIFVSRDVVLHSSLLLVAGVYLFVMAMAGYVVSYWGGEWSTTIQIVLIAASIVVLAAVFMSNQIRTKIKIFITKHFFANQYDYRVEWVKLTKTLSMSSNNLSDVYERALHGFTDSVNYDQGSLLMKRGNFFEKVASLNTPNMTQEQNALLSEITDYCRHTRWILDLHQYISRPFDYPDLHLDKSAINAFQYQIVIPLLHDDELRGVVLLNAKDRESINLDWEVRDYLNAVSDQISSYIYHHENGKALAENAQFAAFSRMSAFVVHDLKNVLAQIDLILCNAEQHKDNPEFIADTFETLEHTKSRMDKMLKQLTEKKEVQATNDAATLISPLIEQVITQQCQGLAPVPELIVQSETQVVVDKEKLKNVMYHLLNNAQQATDDNGFVCVTITYSEASHMLIVSIQDNGCGMSQDFIEHRLFTPFDTTKGNAGMGIGVYDARNYLTAIGGQLSVASEEGKGTCFTLNFPTQ
ncbi:PEP-CTERM system histidine kinase PrsK [Alteromonas sediminis]|uniref:histidine kinase n=1 Tax=Alteromonas sediminis TaxID=2259342 RepID=A0A3N5Y273_9ALTE|nr:XrtA/PEP-CTERM system histidine kinase PrsK [Alteromonas sediminis]RPJ67927.1 PEP-CTERM system histidine kinase PrsK [Alteromonas sediminis]